MTCDYTKTTVSLLDSIEDDTNECPLSNGKVQLTGSCLAWSTSLRSVTYSLGWKSWLETDGQWKQAKSDCFRPSPSLGVLMVRAQSYAELWPRRHALATTSTSTATLYWIVARALCQADACMLTSKQRLRDLRQEWGWLSWTRTMMPPSGLLNTYATPFWSSTQDRTDASYLDSQRVNLCHNYKIACTVSVQFTQY